MDNTTGNKPHDAEVWLRLYTRAFELNGVRTAEQAIEVADFGFAAYLRRFAKPETVEELKRMIFEDEGDKPTTDSSEQETRKDSRLNRMSIRIVASNRPIPGFPRRRVELSKIPPSVFEIMTSHLHAMIEFDLNAIHARLRGTRGVVQLLGTNSDGTYRGCVDIVDRLMLDGGVVLGPLDADLDDIPIQK